jgi:hypothetical protein
VHTHTQTSSSYKVAVRESARCMKKSGKEWVGCVRSSGRPGRGPPAVLLRHHHSMFARQSPCVCDTSKRVEGCMSCKYLYVPLAILSVGEPKMETNGAAATKSFVACNEPAGSNVPSSCSALQPANTLLVLPHSFHRHGPTSPT